jgi:hypothetical protein
MRNTSLFFRTLTSLALPLFVGCAASDVADAPEDESIAEIQEAASGYGRDGSDPNACVDGSTVTKATKNLMVDYEPWDVNSSEAPWGKISLKYSPTCKTFWAKTELVAPLMEGEAARAEVVRFGNNKKTLTCKVPTGKTWCYTPQLYNDGSAFTGQIFADYKYQFRPGRWTVGKKSDSTRSVVVSTGSPQEPGGLGSSYSGNAVVLADELNIRLGPTTDAGVVYKVKKGEILHVRHLVDSNWAFVGYSDSRPIYASARYLKAVATPPEPVAQTWGLQGTRRPPRLAIALNNSCQLNAVLNIGTAAGVAIDAGLNTAVLISQSVGLETTVGCAAGTDLTIMAMPSVDGFAGGSFDIGCSGGECVTFGVSLISSDDGYRGIAMSVGPSLDLVPIPAALHLKRTYTEVRRVDGDRGEQIRNTIQTYINELNKTLPRNVREHTNAVLGGELFSPN